MQPRELFIGKTHPYCHPCYLTYMRDYHAQQPRKHYAKTLRAYFDARVRPQTADICWEWEGWRDNNGYGKGSFRGQEFRAHRVSFALHNGPLKDSDIIMHTCDNPPCVNPSHLRRGAKRDNLADARRKGRHKQGNIRRPRPRPTQRTFRKLPPPATLQEYLDRYTPHKPEGACWEWHGPVSPNGYGHAGYKYASGGAHRLVYELTYGAIPPRHVIRHTCHTRSCVNPAHLRLGTHQDNVHDALKAGRRGRVSPAQVRRIRALRQDGVPIRAIAAQLQLPYTTVQYVTSGKTWKVVQ